MTRVVIVIPTYRRPQSLERLLRELEVQTCQESVAVVVADNDPIDRAGLAAVDKIANAGYRFPLSAVLVSEKGVSLVRNTLLQIALSELKADLIALIDDDEWPRAEWLDALLQAQAKFSAGVVAGPVVSVFDKTPSKAIATCRCFRSERHEDGPLPIVWGACNLLMTRDTLIGLEAPWFDPAYGLSGGEDVELFMRLQSQGCRFAWANDARVFEQVPATRSRLSWVMRRAFRIGNTDMFSQLRWRYAGSPRALVVLRVIGQAIVVALGLPFFLLLPRARIEILYQSMRVFGKLAALGGIHYDEYA